MKISVVIPTYKRLSDLKRCLIAIDKQESLPYEVIVVVKSFDLETLSYIHDWTAKQTIYNRKLCTVSIPGVVEAMIQGVAVAAGDVVAFTDDDSAPDSAWLLTMESHYDDPKVAGVGGRDILVNEPAVPLKTQVGRLTWYGKLIGNHHLGHGNPREVDVLKGVNMSFRKHLIEFPPFLRGSGGPENHNEVGLCLRIKRLGYSLVYDPAIIVKHYASPRIDSEQRHQFNAKTVENSAFNMQMSLLTWLPWYRMPFRLIYSTLIGDKAYPGLMRFLAAVVRREILVVRSYLAAQRGFQSAVMHYSRMIFHLSSKSSRVSPESVAQHKVTTEDV